MTSCISAIEISFQPFRWCAFCLKQYEQFIISYLKLKNITLSYKIPVRSQFLQGLTIWGAANNVFTIAKYLGSDPEFSATNNIIGMGIDRGLLSSGRSFAFGVKIKL